MKAAVVQINSGADRSRNIGKAGSLVAAAADEGAELVVLPEKWSLLGDGAALAEGAESSEGEAVTAARGWARDLGISLLAGSTQQAGLHCQCQHGRQRQPIQSPRMSHLPQPPACIFTTHRSIYHKLMRNDE